MTTITPGSDFDALFAKYMADKYVIEIQALIQNIIETETVRVMIADGKKTMKSVVKKTGQDKIHAYQKTLLEYMQTEYPGLKEALEKQLFG